MSRRFSLTKTLSSVFLSSDEKEEDDDSTNRETSPKEDDEGTTTPSFLRHEKRGPAVASILEKYADKIHDDSFLKIVRQLEFWHADHTDGESGERLSDEDFLALAERLARIASWREIVDGEKDEEKRMKIPTVRFGRTELRMPIVTCGGMRIQQTWMPDNLPLLGANKAKAVKSKSQDNLKDVILSCLKMGLNHFETARMYGSSEVQFVDALCTLMEDGTIKRDDFIFQTKVFVGGSTTRDEFVKSWEASWTNVSKLGHVDLFAFHAIGKDDQIDNLLSEAENNVYGFALELQKAGKIKHIGFSTHGSAANILRLIESNKFSYVNLHKHFFGDYHAQGTPDSLGGHGNGACVKRALELDMGVFCISPFDKGGKLYRPSAAVASAIGPELSPIAFAALHAWKTQGMHTVSVGLARSSDLDEVVEAARIYAEDDNVNDLVKGAEDRLKDLAIQKLGKEWCEKGMLNIPSFYEESSDGLAIGHMLWLHDCLTAYGMYEFAKDRYANLETASWNKSKSFEENNKKVGPGNPGRMYDSSVDLTAALSNHYNPELAKSKLIEVHNWLKKDAEVSEGEQATLGWKQAYNLSTWEEFPGEVAQVSTIILARIGLRKSGGDSKKAVAEAKVMRGIVRRTSSMLLSSDED